MQTLNRLFIALFYCGLAGIETASFPKLQAEKLIRDLNLFPKEPFNSAAPDPSFAAPKIVEKRFSFPHLDYSGPSSEELGHHAGYYRLPHSKAARYAF
jgi:serine carboxypeptidase-like clade 4